MGSGDVTSNSILSPPLAVQQTDIHLRRQGGGVKLLDHFHRCARIARQRQQIYVAAKDQSKRDGRVSRCLSTTERIAARCVCKAIEGFMVSLRDKNSCQSQAPQVLSAVFCAGSDRLGLPGKPGGPGWSGKRGCAAGATDEAVPARAGTDA